MQVIAREPKSLAKIVASPYPDTSVWQRLFNSLTQVKNPFNILVCQGFSAENREVAVNTVFLKLSNYLVDNVFSEVCPDVETL